MNPVKQMNRFVLLATAPFIGIMIWLLYVNLTMTVQLPTFPSPTEQNFSVEIDTVGSKIDQAQMLFLQTQATIVRFHQLYEESAQIATEMVQTARAQVNRPAIIYDRIITARLGTPTQHISSDNIDLKLFHFNESQFKAYALKVQLKSKEAVKLTLGKDKLGESETTLEAAKRFGAIAGVNAGGFADASGKRYPLSNTIIEGQYVYGFEPSKDDLTFIGLSKDLKLIGGKFATADDLAQLKPLFGATFVPALLKNGVKQTIPNKWLTSPRRAPRTVIGNYKDDQLLFIVTDGYNTNGSAGATLPELQDKLLEFGIVDAYNLDGGGSSSLVFNGKIINHPADGELRGLPTHFLFFK